MLRRSRIRSLLCLPALGLALLAPALPTMPTSSAADTTGSLSVSPRSFVGGQLITLSGNIGRTGERTVRLQASMGRVGDSWVTIDRQTTDRAGNFSFRGPAPSMWGVLRRVVTKGTHTPVVKLTARSQDLVLAPDRDPVVGQPFDILVDTVPDRESTVCRLRNRPDLPPPAFPGRTLTLQQRDGSGWRTLATTTTDADGRASFDNVLVLEPSEIVYRVREEDYFRDGNQIGWFPSFPTYVQVVSPVGIPDVPETVPTCPTWGGGSTAREAVSSPRSGGVPATTASQRFGWAPAAFDFGWEHGESLDSPPARGTDPRGRWEDRSDGTGRAARNNGGLMLDSKRDNADGPGDLGSTWVTMRGNPGAYGRWETRVRLKSQESGARDYHVTVELVPDDPDEYRCGGRTITVASMAPHSTTMRFGVNSVKAKRKWTRSVSVGPHDGVAHAVAVEVTKRHISWFLNGAVIGTVRSRAAVSGVPLTPRLTMAGDGEHEMNRNKAIFDWVRGFSLKRGQKVDNGHGLRKSRYGGGC